MANELAHATVGTSCTQTEFEAVGLHVCNSQATGDLIYASSATQLSRLGITNDRILISSGNAPVWSATLPAFAAGGNITFGTNSLVGTACLIKETGSAIHMRNVADDGWMRLYCEYIHTSADAVILGSAHITNLVQLKEMTAPSAGAANTARLYAHLVNGGKTELCVIFQTGAVQVLATEP